jgi:hypothetical protein
MKFLKKLEKELERRAQGKGKERKERKKGNR